MPMGVKASSYMILIMGVLIVLIVDEVVGGDGGPLLGASIDSYIL